MKAEDEQPQQLEYLQGKVYKALTEWFRKETGNRAQDTSGKRVNFVVGLKQFFVHHAA